METRYIALVIVAALVAAGAWYLFSKENVVESEDVFLDDSGWTQSGVDEVVNGNNQFASDLYDELKGEEGNLFFSPYSISTAFAIAYEGADGQTASQMADVMGFSEDDGARRPAHAHVYNMINDNKKPYLLYTGNALWVEQTYRLLDEYVDNIKKYYGGWPANVDFIGDPEGSRQTINVWIEEKTNGRIEDMIKEGLILPDTRLVITNAIYFKGDWDLQFDKAKTKKEDFHVTPDDAVEADMMMTTELESYNFTENDEVKMVELMYKGGDLSMFVLLPKENDIAVAESYLDPESLSGLKAALSEQDVILKFPKFEFKRSITLTGPLRSMGMTDAFEPAAADFSGISGYKDLFITEALHEAFVKVDEEGTEAAAATAIVVGTTSAREISVFYADHPFVFLIQERDTGNILFLGRVMDPTVE